MRDGSTEGLSRIFPVLASLLTALVVALAVAGAAKGGIRAEGRTVNDVLVTELELTDLALWSEASYCRHPSLADSFVAFSDHPAAIEHFPAGSLMPPPPGWTPGQAVEVGEP